MEENTANYTAAALGIFGVGSLLFLSLRLLGLLGAKSDPASFILLWIGIASWGTANLMKNQLAKADDQSGSAETSKPEIHAD